MQPATNIAAPQRARAHTGMQQRLLQNVPVAGDRQSDAARRIEGRRRNRWLEMSLTSDDEHELTEAPPPQEGAAAQQQAEQQGGDADDSASSSATPRDLSQR